MTAGCSRNVILPVISPESNEVPAELIQVGGKHALLSTNLLILFEM